MSGSISHNKKKGCDIMGPTVEELNKVLNIKKQIKQSIINKGVEITDTTPFADYPSLIDSIEAGGGGNSESVWDILTNNGIRGEYLFYNCNKSTSLDLSNFNTNQMVDMSYMFYNCNKLTSIDVSNFDTSKVTTMAYMFKYCYGLTVLDLSNFNTSNVTSMNSMFAGCTILTSIDVSSFNTGKVTNMQYTFENCHKLTSIDVSNFDTSKVTTMSSIFAGCQSLTSLDLSNWDVSKCTSNSSISSMFGTMTSNCCTALVDLIAPKNIGAPMSVQYCTALSHDSLMSIINNLMTVTSSKKLTLGSTNLAKLSDEEKAIATNKGWTLA